MPETKRSVLRVRKEKHIHPARAGETVIEVLRDGVAVAHIYGTREGVQIVSDRFAPDTQNAPFRVVVDERPSVVVPLLAVGEECPWCGGKGILDLDGEHPCPVCRPPV
jgi:hypothetical protein